MIADLPPELEHTLRKAPEKDRDERHQTAKDLAADLKRLQRRLDSVAGRPGPGAGAPVRWRGRAVLASIAALVVIGVAGFSWRDDLGRWFAGAGTGVGTGVPNSANVTIERITGLGEVRSPVISPDGKLLPYTRTEGAENAIWLRQMATHFTRGVVQNAEISPDGRRIAYHRGLMEPDIVLVKPKRQ